MQAELIEATLGGECGKLDGEIVLLMDHGDHIEVLDRREIAKRMRAGGFKIREVAVALDVGNTTVVRWSNAEAERKMRKRARQYKIDNRAHCRAYDKRRNEEIKVPCPVCGEPYGGKIMCTDCRISVAETRHSLIAGMYNDGWPMAEMALAMECTVNALGPTMHKMRARGQLGWRYVIGTKGYRCPPEKAAA